MNRPFVLALFALGVTLAACGGGSTNPTPPPTPGPACQLPSGTQSALVYPAPSATGVVDNNGQIVIGSNPALPVGQTGQNWGIVIADAVYPGGAVLSNTALANTTPPFPSPNATPSFASPTYQTQAAGVPFAANQIVQVYLNNSASNCTPRLLGQFST